MILVLAEVGDVLWRRHPLTTPVVTVFGAASISVGGGKKRATRLTDHPVKPHSPVLTPIPLADDRCPTLRHHGQYH
ncbi:hypothetical protein TNCV_812411 [Trichonephila clavipes]|nr:hypothetical protein TNCV_812411 [Trichonephila clavipes]